MTSPPVAERRLDLAEEKDLPLNLADEFARIAASRPSATAVVVSKDTSNGREYRTLNFARTVQMTDLYARGLRESGIERGQKVLILMQPMLDLVPVFLALWKIGAVPVAVDAGAPKEEKFKAIVETAPEAFVGIPKAHLLRVLYRPVFRSVRHAVVAAHRWSPGGPHLGSFLRTRHAGPVLSAPTRASDPLMISYTLGSTGPAKGVVYTVGNGAAVVEVMREALGIRPEDVCLACHPAFAIYFLGAGATVVLPDLDVRFPAKADPAGVLDVIRAQKPRIAFMQLPIIGNLVRYCSGRREKIPHLETILTTGASVSPAFVTALHAVLENPAADLAVTYGAVEALSLCYATGRDILAAAAEAGEKGTFVGRPARGIRVGIIPISKEAIESWRPEMLRAPGEIGEICVSGPVVTPAYNKRPETTRKAKIPDGDMFWHRMGDAGYLDQNGQLWFCGRTTDRVETGHGTLFSELVEPAFNVHPQVRRSALVGVPQAGTAAKLPVILVEPLHTEAQMSSEEDSALRRELLQVTANNLMAGAIQEIFLYRGEFPMDVRHNAKIRRDLLVEYAGQCVREEREKQFASNTISFQGHRIAYYQKGAGEAMLFLHDAGNDHRIWEHQLEYFSRCCRVVGADSLGYGNSDNPRIAYTLPLYTDMVAAVIDSLSLAPVTLVGTCTGAAMALNYALQHPHKVKRLILFHIATPKTAAVGCLQAQTRLLSGRPRLARMVAPLMEAFMSRTLAQDAVIRRQYGEDPESQPEFVSHLRRLYGKKGEATCLVNLFSNWESFAPLDTVTWPADFPPLHVLWGEANQVLRVERGRELCERLRPVSFEVIPGGGHLVMRQRPDTVIRRIEELAALPGLRATAV